MFSLLNSVAVQAEVPNLGVDINTPVEEAQTEVQEVVPTEVAEVPAETPVEESVVEVTGGIASVHYIELTTDALSKYGINVVREGDTFKIPAKTQAAVPDGNFEVEGDWSNGAFLICLGSLIHGGSAKVTGLNMQSVQGDRAIMRFLMFFLLLPDIFILQASLSCESKCRTSREHYSENGA